MLRASGFIYSFQGLDNLDTSIQFPAIIASFFALLHPFI
jgi:hypothetical protein